MQEFVVVEIETQGRDDVSGQNASVVIFSSFLTRAGLTAAIFSVKRILRPPIIVRFFAAMVAKNVSYIQQPEAIEKAKPARAVSVLFWAGGRSLIRPLCTFNVCE